MRQTTFDFEHAHTRATDPIQSDIAGEAVNVTRNELKALEAIQANEGATAKQLELSASYLEGYGYQEGAIRKRLAQMERKNMITRVLDKEINEFRIWEVK